MWVVPDPGLFVFVDKTTPREPIRVAGICRHLNLLLEFGVLRRVPYWLRWLVGLLGVGGVGGRVLRQNGGLAKLGNVDSTLLT